MKKIYSIMMVAAIAFAFTSCEEGTLDGSDDTEQGGGGEGTDNPGGETQDPNTLTYGGVTYKTVTLSNGQTWMAEPLRYVPDGMTVSSDPADDNAHIWYPYELTNEGEITAITATGASALTDEASIAEYGYLYDMYAALGGIEITADNCYNYEGAQGICPDGWHIPTRAEYLALCGYANKTTPEGEAETDATALFFDQGYNGGKISLFDEGGWNFVRSGYRQKNNFASKGQYSLTQLYPNNTSLEDQYGTQALTYIMASTCYQPTYNTNNELTNIQYFSLMTTFSSKLYPEGRVTVAHSSICIGQQLRCVSACRTATLHGYAVQSRRTSTPHGHFASQHGSYGIYLS